MKAMVYTRFGEPEDVLRLQEVEKPTPRDDEVLVEIHAAAVNFGDWSFTRGKPSVVRMIGAGLLKPKHRTLGSDIAGRVEAVGAKVKRFQPGDEVYGEPTLSGWGGFAEYSSAPEKVLARKPANLSFEEAAAVPQAASVALQALRDGGRVQPGHRVLVDGASGGIGTFAVQIAKALGAEVTGVCSTGNLELVRSLGADHVIDYTREDVTENQGHYDAIIDIVSKRPASEILGALRPEGRLVTVAMNLSTMSARGTEGRKAIALAAKTSVEDLDYLRGLIEAGEVSPVIDSVYPLTKTAEALRRYGERHSRGKVVVTVEHERKVQVFNLGSIV